MKTIYEILHNTVLHNLIMNVSQSLSFAKIKIVSANDFASLSDCKIKMDIIELPKREGNLS